MNFRPQVILGALLTLCGLSATSLGFTMQRLLAYRDLADLNLQQSVSLAAQIIGCLGVFGGAMIVAYSILKKR